MRPNGRFGSTISLTYVGQVVRRAQPLPSPRPSNGYPGRRPTLAGFFFLHRVTSILINFRDKMASILIQKVFPFQRATLSQITPSKG